VVFVWHPSAQRTTRGRGQPLLSEVLTTGRSPVNALRAGAGIVPHDLALRRPCRRGITNLPGPAVLAAVSLPRNALTPDFGLPLISGAKGWT